MLCRDRYADSGERRLAVCRRLAAAMPDSARSGPGAARDVRDGDGARLGDCVLRGCHRPRQASCERVEEAPIVEHPDDSFVAISSVAVRPSIGGGHLVEHQPADGRPYHFQRSWIKHDLRADPANLRIMHVEGDSMMPTLHDGDIVLVDLGRRSPTPPGYSYFTTAWGSSPSGWSISPTAIRRGSASFRTTLSTSRMKAAVTRSTSLDGYAGSRARCDVRACAEEVNIVGRVVGAAERLRAIR